MNKPFMKHKNKNLYLAMGNYTDNGRIYLELLTKEGSCYAEITKNLSEMPVIGNKTIF